jgi:hypothetical protein
MSLLLILLGSTIRSWKISVLEFSPWEDWWSGRLLKLWMP